MIRLFKSRYKIKPEKCITVQENVEEMIDFKVNFL